MQGKTKFDEHTSHVIIQLNIRDSLLKSGSHEVDIQRMLTTVKLEVAEDKVGFHKFERSTVLRIKAGSVGREVR